MKFKAWVKDKETKQYTTIESNYQTKTEFIKDLRENNYSVNPYKVKEALVYDYIIANTSCTPSDWKEINEVPENEETIKQQKQDIDFQDLRVNKISACIYYVQSNKLNFEVRVVIRKNGRISSQRTNEGRLGNNNNLMMNFLYSKNLITIDQVPELITESDNNTIEIESTTENKTVEQNIKTENSSEVTTTNISLQDINIQGEIKENKLNTNKKINTTNLNEVTEVTTPLHNNDTT